jgi:hypothetical protein
MHKVKKDPAQRERQALDLARYIDEAAAAGRPLTLRIDDRPPLVIQDEPGYQKLWELVDDLETAHAIQQALEEVERGEAVPIEEFDRRMREKYGIPD